MAGRILEQLTPRETQVIAGLKAGLSNKAIARSMDLSEQTVKFHLKNIFTKIGATCRVHAVLLITSDEAQSPPSDSAAAHVLRRHMEPALSPLALLRRTRKLYGDRIAVVDEAHRFTYAEFADRCLQGARALHSLGLAHGERVATVALNTHAHLEQFFAVPLAGGVIVPINHRLSPGEIVEHLHHAGARVVMASREFVALLNQVRHELAEVAYFIAFDESAEGWLSHDLLLRNAPADFTPAEPDENELLAINYTSGTAAEPRGVMVSHRNAWINTIGCLAHWPLSPADRYLWLLPFFHGSGWGFVWTVTAAGAAHVCTRSTAVETMLGPIIAEGVTVLCAGRSVLMAIATLPDESIGRLPSGLRVLTAGAPPSAPTLEQIETRLGWRITHAYGLTETAVFVAIRLPPHDAAAPASPADRARWNVVQGVDLYTSGEVRVVDEEGVDVPRDGITMGEVVTRGPSLMLGYYRDPEATRRAFAGGWFHTGDAAVMHPDGALEVRDRIKDIIISNDQLIAPTDVERALCAHPAVSDAAVVGVSDPVLGESIQAYVVVSPRHPVDVRELHAFAAEHLADFKRPQAIHRVDYLPRTGSGKILKHQLRSLRGQPYS